MNKKIDLAAVKNIIFDLGGVILNIDFQRPVERFRKLGIDDFERFYSKELQNSLFDKLETGLIGMEEFYNTIRLKTGLNITDAEIQQAWNTILLDFPKERIEVLEELRMKYRLFLLSNTNIIHYNNYSSTFKDQFNKPFSSLFEKAYYSFQLGLRKPNREIYEYVINDVKLKPEDTLFLDDSGINLVEPQKMGMHTILISNEMPITKIFSDGM